MVQFKLGVIHDDVGVRADGFVHDVPLQLLEQGVVRALFLVIVQGLDLIFEHRVLHLELPVQSLRKPGSIFL